MRGSLNYELKSEHDIELNRLLLRRRRVKFKNKWFDNLKTIVIWWNKASKKLCKFNAKLCKFNVNKKFCKDFPWGHSSEYYSSSTALNLTTEFLLDPMLYHWNDRVDLSRFNWKIIPNKY